MTSLRRMRGGGPAGVVGVAVGVAVGVTVGSAVAAGVAVAGVPR